MVWYLALSLLIGTVCLAMFLGLPVALAFFAANVTDRGKYGLDTSLSLGGGASFILALIVGLVIRRRWNTQVDLWINTIAICIVVSVVHVTGVVVFIIRWRRNAHLDLWL